ncbi:MAG: LCP family protein [Candidatus Saganbacteria bacterium]|nr:LCP family protein [Candidatus Saganbacteria bacterium]
MNVLIMGTDIVYDIKTNKEISKSGLTDTLILASFFPRSGKITLLSIPRDTRVMIPGYGYSKINRAHLVGGPELSQAIVNDLTDIPIDGYIIVNPGGIVKLVDLVGGIKVYVDKDMNYVDKAGHLYINLKKGWKVLSGEEAHGYLRYRLDAMGDLTRVERQQVFLKQLLKKIANPSIIMRVPWVFNIMRENLETSFSLREILELGNFGRVLKRNDILIVTLPGNVEERTGLWIPDREGIKDLVKKHFLIRRF